MASRRKQRRQQCVGKLRHVNESGARVQAAIAKQRHGIVLAVYLCSFCSGWHIGHNVRVMKRAGFHVFRKTRRKV